jgi:hypothetical protein
MSYFTSESDRRSRGGPEAEADMRTC